MKFNIRGGGYHRRSRRGYGCLLPILSLILIISLSLFGCGSSKSASPASSQPTQQTAQQQNSCHGLIKGNINAKGEKIYHVPGGRFYDKCKPEKWFKTEQEAQAAGFRPSKR